MGFNDIKVGVNRKYYTHNLHFTNNTTANFGYVQPKFQILMEDGDSLSCSYSEVMRLAPLPVPTLGDVYEETYTRFVPAVELCPWFSFIRAQKPYAFPQKTIIPNNVPEISNAFLVNYLINNCCRYAICVLEGTVDSAGKYAGGFTFKGDSTSETVKSFLTTYYKSNPNIFGSKAQNLFANTVYVTYSDGTVNFDNADFILPSTDNKTFLLAKLDFFGRRLRKVFIGLGYGLNINDNEPVSLLPLLAYYKAYFDTYNPARVSSWSETDCYKLVKMLENDYSTTSCKYNDFSGAKIPVETQQQLAKVLFTISYNFYPTEVLNYISAHRDNPNNNLNYSFTALAGDTTVPVNVILDGSEDTAKAPMINTREQPILTSVALKLLNRVTRFANKDSVIGNKINDWLRVHGYGDLDNSLLHDSTKCSYHRLNAPISAVFSTSDTAQGDGSGEYLGSYAGKAVGSVDGQKFKFTASKAGFFIVLSCVKSDSAFCGGNEGTLYCVDRDTMFIDEYDGLGFEISSKHQLFPDGGVGWCVGSNLQGNLNDSGFGYIPRYSRMKQKRNIVNGDMSLRGTSANMTPYYLDKIISNNKFQTLAENAVRIQTYKLPEASEVWQYYNYLSFIGNYNRIFYNSGKYGQEPENDNFILQTVYHIKLRSRMKTITESYDTFDESHDTSIANQKQS